MTQLSVNVNKLATIRNARGKNNPDVVQWSLDIVKFGAFGITVHPRPDERHIRRKDVYDLKEVLDVEFNIEGYPTDDFLEMVSEIAPAQATLVPDPPDAITSNAGWIVRENREILENAAKILKAKAIRVSVFVDPTTASQEDFRTLKNIGVDRIELYTEAYAETFGKPENDQVLATYKRAAQQAKQEGLGLNAGHDLDLENLAKLIESIPEIDEVSIGHALVCDALKYGMEETIRRYLNAIEEGQRAANSRR